MWLSPTLKDASFADAPTESSLMKKGLVALLDCNNFFVSCERVFRPDLLGKPVIVLSSNDGCVVARSNEAKSIGIPMGIPFFQIKETVEKEGVQIFSGNFPLYEDISRRVMRIARDLSDKMERYSIDESFLFFYGEEEDLVERVRMIKREVERGAGVPVSIGIASTKTLAKLASEHAKKEPTTGGVFFLEEDIRSDFLKNIPAREVWGIGAKTSQKLSRYNIRTAYGLTNSSDGWIRSNLGLGTLRTAFELRGVKAFSKGENDKSKKSIISSRSFGKKVNTLEELEEAVASHVSSAASKMRQSKDCAGYISVTIQTARSGPDGGRSVSSYRELTFPTDSTIDLIRYAHEALGGIFKPGVSYSKAGILLSNISPKELAPKESLFESSDKRYSELMTTIDAIDKKYGKSTVFPAAIGTKQTWKQRQEFQSPKYTTSWKDLPKARA